MLIGVVGADESKREVPTADAARFAEEEGLLFVEASAKSGDGVEDAFVRAARSLIRCVFSPLCLVACADGVLG
jgi:Ras-related protein Rab-2A